MAEVRLSQNVLLKIRSLFSKSQRGKVKEMFKYQGARKRSTFPRAVLELGDSATRPASFGRLPADGTVIASVSRAGTKHSLLIDVTECVSESSLF